MVHLRDTNDVAYIGDYLTNRYDESRHANITCDDAGNLTKDRRGYWYEYDYENRIVKITKDSNDIAEFACDALGRRLTQKGTGTPAGAGG
ncbi:MAG: hypothetical protein ACYST6_13765 [Planctomycetota bacterium]|jgi:YD repeat-containing protein